MEEALVVEVTHLGVAREGAALQVARLEDAILVIAPHAKRRGCRNRQIITPRLKVDDAYLVVVRCRRNKQAAVAHGTHGAVAGMVQHLVIDQNAR